MTISLGRFLSVVPMVSIIGVTSAQAAQAADLIKQEFQGTFTLTNASILLEGTLPESTAYAGFVTYEEGGVLGDWQLDVTGLDLSLSQDSNFDPFLVPPDVSVNFYLTNSSNWELALNFGIASDGPGYFLTRNDSEITLKGSQGLLGGYTYNDSDATITQSQPQTSVPEPGTVLSLFALGSLGLAFSTKRQFWAG